MSPRGYYSQNQIDEVRDRADIVQVISEYLTLRPAGQNFKANCPFHKEKTPSFMVNPSRQMFRCFGCGESGNVFGFLMKINGMTFVEAVRTLASRYGVSLESVDGEEADRSARLRQNFLEINRKVAAHFQRNLANDETGARALEYLRARGVSDDSIRTFQIGWARDGWDDICKTFGSKPSDLELLMALGLVAKSKQGSYYDRFRARIVFPIIDISGNVRGFGGRILGSEVSRDEEREEAKYLNSPESPVYQKGRILYGLNQARDSVRSEGFVTLVEGYMDVIALFEAGIHNVVATCGTALTPQQCGLIKRYTERPVVFFDSDSAGTTASIRSFALFTSEGLRPLAFKAGGEFDPDDYVKEVGGTRLMEELRQAVPFPEFLINEALRKHDIKKVEGKLAVLKEALPSFTQLTQIEVNHYVRLLADELSVEQEAVFAELGKLSRKPRIGDEIPALKEREFNIEERDLVTLVAIDTEALGLASETVSPDLITSPFLREVFMICLESYQKGTEMVPSALLDRFDDPAHRDFITQLAFCEQVIDKRGFMRLVDCLKHKSLMREAHKTHQEYLSALPCGDTAKEVELARELTELKQSGVVR
ncbi:MAG: DNA primase [Candidatus Coatesbacteria bacterium]|nr:DNA primase [Candidatus Coatesbacteria bacterium]